jgi:hypothetical protein
VEQPAVQQTDTVADPNRSTEVMAQKGVVQIAPSYRKRPYQRVGVRLKHWIVHLAPLQNPLADIHQGAHTGANHRAGKRSSPSLARADT